MATLPHSPPSSAEIARYQETLPGAGLQIDLLSEADSFAGRLQQEALEDDVNWLHQPAFAEEFYRLTDGEPLTEIDIHLRDEHRREVNWNFTADDRSFTE